MDIEDVIEDYSKELSQLDWDEWQLESLGNDIELSLLITSLDLQRQINDLKLLLQNPKV